MPFLGHIPLLKKKNNWEKNKDRSLAAYDKEVPEIAEAFRYIRVTRI